jgi:hypothetical protein
MQLAASLRGTIRRHPGRWAAVAAIVALGAFALYWFAPWNLVLDRRVDEAAPGVVPVDAVGEGTAGPTGAAGPTAAGVADDTTGGGGVDPTGPRVVAGGEFHDLEHATSGTALVLELEDGARFLRLEDLDTSNGPDLRVILSDRPLSEDWHVWDDGEYVDLGALKGNLGSSNYEIPADLELDRFETAVIWCRRFSVGFGVAPLEALET